MIGTGKRNPRKSLGILVVLAFLLAIGVVEYFASKAQLERQVRDKATERAIHGIKAQAAEGASDIEVTIARPPAR